MHIDPLLFGRYPALIIPVRCFVLSDRVEFFFQALIHAVLRQFVRKACANILLTETKKNQ